MRLLATLLMVCSAFFIACATNVPRPDTSVCLNDVPKLQQQCYNLKRDYDDNGNLLKDAKPVVIQYKDEAAMLAALNKNFATDPQGWANLKAYLRALRAAQ